MQIAFKNLVFLVTECGSVGLMRLYSNQPVSSPELFANHVIPEFDVAGGTLSGQFKRCGSDETKALRYVSHEIVGNCLTLVQKNDKFQVTSVYQGYDDTNAIRVTQRYQNISATSQTLTQANTFGFCFGKSIMGEHKDWYFHRFTNARYTESMPDIRSLYDCKWKQISDWKTEN